eukprot:gene5270-6107_t
MPTIGDDESNTAIYVLLLRHRACLELYTSLFDVLNRPEIRPLPLSLIRPFLSQVLSLARHIKIYKELTRQLASVSIQDIDLQKETEPLVKKMETFYPYVRTQSSVEELTLKACESNFTSMIALGKHPKSESVLIDKNLKLFKFFTKVTNTLFKIFAVDFDDESLGNTLSRMILSFRIVPLDMYVEGKEVTATEISKSDLGKRSLGRLKLILELFNKLPLAQGSSAPSTNFLTSLLFASLDLVPLCLGTVYTVTDSPLLFNIQRAQANLLTSTPSIITKRYMSRLVSLISSPTTHLAARVLSMSMLIFVTENAHEALKSWICRLVVEMLHCTDVDHPVLASQSTMPLPTSSITFLESLTTSNKLITSTVKSHINSTLIPFCFQRLGQLNPTKDPEALETTLLLLNAISISEIPLNTNDCNELNGEYCVDHKGNMTCQVANYAMFGEYCKVDYECAFGLDCVNEKCATPAQGCINDGHCNRTSEQYPVMASFVP